MTANSAAVVRIQAELDEALAANTGLIEIRSPAGVWLTVMATGSSTVTATDSSTVTAYGSSTVTAYGSSTVRAYSSSTVTATDSSTVRAYGSSTVTASPCVAVHLHSGLATIDGGVVIDVTTVNYTAEKWCAHHGVEVTDGIATVYKAVSDQWTTPRGADYTPGSTPEATDWADNAECGQGLHFGPTPAHALAYLPDATRFVAVGVELATLRPIPGGIAKCKAPKVVRACVEVDLDGNEVES